jgi:type I restriction enzyme, S subunit
MLLTKALYYQLQPMVLTLRAGSTGSAQGVIAKDDIEQITLRVPPKAEQTRIVASLDKLLATIDVSQRRLTVVSSILKRFRQSVLAAACSGRLTSGWRVNRQNCQWEDLIIADVIKEKPRNGYSANPVLHQTPYKVLTLTATTSGRFDGKHFKFFDKKISKESSHWLQPGDILIQRGNTIEYVGVSAIYTGTSGEFIYPDLMMRIRANSRVRTKFLYYALSWEDTREYLRERATGTAGNMPKINQETLMGTPIKLPSVDEQDEIIRRVDRLLALADRIQARYEAAKMKVDRLPQSTLARAFRGELVPTEAELAEREGRPHESADQLLQRIRTAKPGASSTTKRKRHVG